MTWIVIIVSLLLALIRVSGHKSQAYQAVAHLWVGWLAGLWTIQRGALEAWLIVGLSIVEVACFVYFRRGGKSGVDPDPHGARSGVQGIRDADFTRWPCDRGSF